MRLEVGDSPYVSQSREVFGLGSGVLGSGVLGSGVLGSGVYAGPPEGGCRDRL